MKNQTNDREEFKTLIFEIMMKQNPGVKNFPLGQLGTKLLYWIETYTQKKVKEEREKTLKEVREIIEITKQNYAYNSHGGRALKELLSKIKDLKER